MRNGWVLQEITYFRNTGRFPVPDFLLQPSSALLSTAASLNLRHVDFHHFRAIWELAYCAFSPACRYPYPGFATRLFRQSLLNPLQPFRVPENEWTGLVTAGSERCFAIMTLARGSTGILREGEHLKELLSIISSYFTYRRYIVDARREYK